MILSPSAAKAKHYKSCLKHRDISASGVAQENRLSLAAAHRFSVEILLRILAVSPLPLLALLNGSIYPDHTYKQVGITCINTARLLERTLYRKALTTAGNGLHAPAFNTAVCSWNTLEDTVRFCNLINLQKLLDSTLQAVLPELGTCSLLLL